MSRLFGILVILIWGSATLALLSRDVLPYWSAHRPPRGVISTGQVQVGIFSARDRRIGRSWVKARKLDRLVTLTSVTQLDTSALPLPSAPHLVGSVVFDSHLTFDSDENLHDFELHVLGMPLPIKVEGHLLGIDYSCLARIGAWTQKFSLDARASQQIAEAVRPFTHLPNLHVGQMWQLQVLEPMSLLAGGAAEFRPLLVRVTGRERIPHAGRQVECFRLEADRANAWVDDDGRVLVQVVEAPLLGKITLRDEPFEEELLRQARKSVHAPDSKSPGAVILPKEIQPHVNPDRPRQ